jgi:hypothetical protein
MLASIMTRRGMRTTAPGAITVTGNFTVEATSWIPNTILRAGEPATAQFRQDRLVILASTPADKTGPLHRSYQRALQIDPDTGTGAHPTTLAIQLPSWDVYVDWERADQIEMWPGGPCFARLKRSILDEDDDEVVKLRQVDPETYLVEYEAQWRTSKAA